jgi:hypothetical protein
MGGRGGERKGRRGKKEVGEERFLLFQVITTQLSLQWMIPGNPDSYLLGQGVHKNRNLGTDSTLILVA